jgi:hypothetical protein
MGPSGTILALADYGPELLYRTRHQVLAIPNHRPQPGFNAGFRALVATDMRAARAELDQHGVDWILLCPSIVEHGHFIEGREADVTLYRRLLEGSAPPWVRPMALPDDLGEVMRLYAIEPPAELAGDPDPSSNRR